MEKEESDEVEVAAEKDEKREEKEEDGSCVVGRVVAIKIGRIIGKKRVSFIYSYMRDKSW